MGRLVPTPVQAPEAAGGQLWSTGSAGRCLCSPLFCWPAAAALKACHWWGQAPVPHAHPASCQTRTVQRLLVIPVLWKLWRGSGIVISLSGQLRWRQMRECHLCCVAFRGTASATACRASCAGGRCVAAQVCASVVQGFEERHDSPGKGSGVHWQ